ncbi:MAG: 16S rRNA (uracil(1498)-N(3))-methyltransferase [Oscillatoria sp. SIO1A7]|nr:16S rRNA (uracil(1498)-N(3))-methyltransferase [Oscillatoria sp. SIO1A7]
MAQLQRLTIAPEQIQDQHIILSYSQQHYLIGVLRLGDRGRFIAMDGQGHWWLAALSDAKGKKAKILEPIPAATELPSGIALIIAMPKGNNAFDELVRQTTEIGVARIYPVTSQRSLLKPSQHKLERWRRIATEAAEQSERQQVPTVAEPISFEASLSLPGSDRYICVARGDTLAGGDTPHLLDCLQKASGNSATGNLASGQDSSPTIEPSASPPDSAFPSSGSSSILIATGPEGGWTRAEVELAIAAGFVAVSLGRRILTARTAPIFAASLAAAVLEARAIAPYIFS